MIVDMIRNDLGKICEPGTVRVVKLFDVERFWTVLQMTSTVEGLTTASLSEIMTALFPCASVTGAPKVRTMEIIRELETGPRGAYTGCIGYVLPGRRATFSVAIRTAWVDGPSSSADYGVGGGIVWDSSPAEEYEECLLKARALTASVPRFELLETILWETDGGYFLLDRHLGRLARSARHFGYPVDLDSLQEELELLAIAMPGPRCKVRVLVARDGSVEIERSTIPAQVAASFEVGISHNIVDSQNVFLYHKTTHRAVYENAMNGIKYADVLLVNERGEITESTTANVVIESQGKRITPALSCGLLAGTFRQYLLEKKELEEVVIRHEDLLENARVWLINSVRRWVPIRLVIGDWGGVQGVQG